MANASLKGFQLFLGKDAEVLGGRKMYEAKNEIQELHAKEVGVGNPSEERASS